MNTQLVPDILPTSNRNRLAPQLLLSKPFRGWETRGWKQPVLMLSLIGEDANLFRCCSFSASVGPMAAASVKCGNMARSMENIKFERL